MVYIKFISGIYLTSLRFYSFIPAHFHHCHPKVLVQHASNHHKYGEVAEHLLDIYFSDSPFSSFIFVLYIIRLCLTIRIKRFFLKVEPNILSYKCHFLVVVVVVVAAGLLYYIAKILIELNRCQRLKLYLDFPRRAALLGPICCVSKIVILSNKICIIPSKMFRVV